MPKTPYRVIGTRPIRPDGVDKVTGRAQYGADVSMPGLLYGRVLRSPHAHARIKRIGTAKAAALPGVLAVITQADFTEAREKVGAGGSGARGLGYTLDNVLAGQKVLYRGHAVAAVAATDLHIAEDALALIDVEYEVLPAVLDVREAMTDTAPLVHEDLHTRGINRTTSEKPSNIARHMQFAVGDVAAGFAQADVVLEREYETTMVHQGYIEPLNGTAFWNQDGQLTVWTSTQGAFIVRNQTASLMGLSVSRVKVVPMEIGGGFGGKIPVYLEPLAAILSRQTGRPVKLTMSRQDVFEATGPTSGAYVRVKLGATKDGRIVAAEATLVYEAGAYPGSPVGSGASAVFAPYDIANQGIDAYDVVVNKPKVGAYRAPGAPQAAFAAESLVNELADRLDLDPIAIRRLNSAHEGTRRADGFVAGPIGAEACLDAAQRSPHWTAELQGEHRGRGIASGWWSNAGMESSAYASVNSDGTVGFIFGSVDIGGSRASLAMQLAETLGIAAEDVKPQVVDTDSVGFTMMTGGSRTTFAGGWAAYEVGRDIRAQLEQRAARIWECDAAEVHYGADGVITGPPTAEGETRSFTFKQIAAELPRTGGMVQSQADVNKSSAGPAYGTHIVDVEVDPQTGKVGILRYTAIQDAGTAIHPAYVEGQMQGGAVQGVGMALNEEYVYDAGGNLLNPTLLDYRIPTTLDVPDIETVIVEVPNPGHPYGVRGVGEVPIVPGAAAVQQAIYNAIAVRMTKLPMSPKAILEKLQADA